MIRESAIELQRRAETAEARLRHLEEQCRLAEERAARASKSAADAWAFARVLLATGPRRDAPQ